jgi:hypothetical protein
MKAASWCCGSSAEQVDQQDLAIRFKHVHLKLSFFGFSLLFPGATMGAFGSILTDKYRVYEWLSK